MNSESKLEKLERRYKTNVKRIDKLNNQIMILIRKRRELTQKQLARGDKIEQLKTYRDTEPIVISSDSD